MRPGSLEQCQQLKENLTRFFFSPLTAVRRNRGFFRNHCPFAPTGFRGPGAAPRRSFAYVVDIAWRNPLVPTSGVGFTLLCSSGMRYNNCIAGIQSFWGGYWASERGYTVKRWEVDHGGNAITVENRAGSERLYVNGELQDERMGLSFQSRLWGQLNTGEMIKVSIGGNFRIHCRIFVDNKLVLSD